MGAGYLWGLHDAPVAQNIPPQGSWRANMGMQVVFYKVDEGRLCAWVAAPPKRKRFQGTTMASGRDLPHDLAQFVVEATLGLPHGFWACWPTVRPSGASLDAAARSRASSSSACTVRRSTPPSISRTLT